MAFKSDFMWGAASAAAQIEGAYNEDGKGLSIWDVLYDGHTKHNDSPHVACDHYHRLEEDVENMKKIGLKYYRFSVSWPRIIPDGTGRVNQKGLNFYRKLVDLLLKAGIEPMVTLYHWDLPYELYKKGGWQNDESPEWFAQYVKVVVDALSDKVKYWMTINEPNCFIGISYFSATHAPFLHDKNALYPCTRNVLFAHARAVRVIRETAKTAPVVGFAPTGPIFKPENDSEEAIKKAYKKTFSNDIKGPFSTGWWIDPVVLGKNPVGLDDFFGKPLFSSKELQQVCEPLDFLGFNIYIAAGHKNGDSFYETNEYIGCPRNSLN